MDIGFYLINADHSEKCNAIIDTLNRMVENHPYDNIILFNNQYNRIDNEKKFPILHINQAKYFRGCLILFDIKSVVVTKSFPSPAKQLLYLDDIPWSKDGNTPVLFWHDIFLNPDISIIADSETTKDLLTLCWRAPTSVMPKINEKELYDSIIKI